MARPGPHECGHYELFGQPLTLPEKYGDQEHGGWALTVEPGSGAIELKYDVRSR